MDIVIKKNIDTNYDYALDINNAMEEVSKIGGRVIIPSGEFKCTTIYFKDNVCLYLEKGAKLVLYPDLDKFVSVNDTRDSSIKRPTWEDCEYNGLPSKYFIYAKDNKNISIKGEGSIDGNEELFYGTVTKYHIEGSFYPRIPLIFMENTKDIIIEGVTLTRSAFWTVHLLGCINVLVNKVNIINNLKLTNCDGIDPDRSKNVTIKDCNISCADDCVVLKATSASLKYGDTTDIFVSNCNFTSTSAAIKIGTETCGNFNNIIFDNINITSSNRGISLMLRDNGNISNCVFKNIKMNLRLFSKIHWWGSDEGIAITAVPRKDVVGKISNLKFENIDINSENGILIYGYNNNISNIDFNNVNLVINKKTDYEHKLLDLRPSIFDIIERPFYGLTIENASDIIFNNFNIQNDTSYIKEIYNISNSNNIKL